MYEILQYTLDRAEEIGVEVKPSKNKKKKIDVFIDGEKIASVGAYGMMDYPHYILSKGLDYANKRRELYYRRHRKVSLNEILAKWLLW